MKNHKTISPLLLCIALPLSLHAQTKNTSEPHGTLENVIVTAEHRKENLQKLPISTSVINGNTLRMFQADGSDTLLSLSGRSPSLYVESTTGRIFPRFYIRGLGNNDFYLGASQPVSIIQDDVVLEHVVLKSNPAFDIQQVEVLRGPQGSLFGRNTTAGTIRFDSYKPTNDFHGRADVSYGSYNTTNMDLGFGGPLLANILSFRLSGLFQHRDNWVDNRFAGPSDDGTATPRKNALGGFDERDARLQFLFTPTARLSILASGHARDYDGTSTLFYRQSIQKGTNAVPQDFHRNSVQYDEGQNNPQSYHTYGGSINAAYDLNSVKLTSITAYETSHGWSLGDTDGGAAANYPVRGVPNGYGLSRGRLRGLDQVTEELRLANNDKGRWKWQIGGLYFNSHDNTEFDQRAFFLNTAAHNPNNWVLLHDVNTSWGIFGQSSYQLTKRLTLTGGVRLTNDTKNTWLLHTANTIANVATYTGRRYVRLSATKPSWDVSALYQLTSNVNAYARIARGFRGPTIQGRSAVFNADFTTANAETNTSYEAGLKTQLWNNRLRLNTDGFYYVVDNIQLNGNDSNGNGVLFNANKARGWGMESEAELRPISNLLLTAGVSLLHTEIDDKRVYAQVCALNGAVVCTVENPTINVRGSTFAQINGNPLPNAPRYNLNFTARYDLPIGHGDAFWATDWNVQGYTSFVPYKTKEFTSNGNFEGGMKLGYSWKKYEMAVFVRNITNNKNLKGVIDNYMAGVYNDPRIIGISAHTRF
ncbi:TonB-dependent receptor [Neokomagataea anthophila]|uniref:TonB-dependent receptor n=1 Tax=Neokomagataea anthophila TaxID=2826925 RepID=A0ABS5E4W2_9PROT|nr:TonB-dependent receptor [Neokomagataea anthophila]